MPIVPTIGRKTWTGRLTIIVIYTVLIIGAVTMMYPFSLMLSCSITSPFDFEEFSLVPSFLRNDDALLKKYLFDKYRTRRSDIAELAVNYGKESEWINWNDIRGQDDFIANVYGDSARNYERRQQRIETIVSDWSEFKKSLPPVTVSVYFQVEAELREYLEDKYRSTQATGREHRPDSKMKDKERTARALAMLNRRYGRAYNNFSEVLPFVSFFYEQGWFPYQRPDFEDWVSFKKDLPAEFIDVVTGRRMWVRYLSKHFASVKELADATGHVADTFSTVLFPVTEHTPELYKVYTRFLRTKYPLRLVTVSERAGDMWAGFLKDRFGDISRYNSLLGESAASFGEVPFSLSPPEDVSKRVVWLDFVSGKVPLRHWDLHLPEYAYRAFLRARYGTVDAINGAYGSSYTTFDEMEPPWKLVDYHEFRTQRKDLRWDFATRNYRTVFAFLTTKGRAIFTTAVLVTLAIVSALTVNPLAAYVLSRCNQGTASKILIFFLATMAFPAEVAMIPGFLLLKQLGLLNTFAALVLPGLANGYSIFLLKGFFDSIPRELYEAATIDGASEFQVFRLITFPMSKPILAVIALAAFNAAYGGFMWAFLTCQDPQMWTIMVWLYDFQTRYAAQPGMVMAALTVASIPTLFVFLFCQRIIMRGIIIPTMK